MQKVAPNFIIVAALLSGCGDSFTGDRQDQVVKYSTRSANGSVEASIVIEGFGATVPEVYSIRIRQGDNESGEIMKADHVQNLTVRWKDDKNLEINLDCGRIFQFTNFFDVIDKGGSLIYGINIRLLNTSLCDI
jgi:hypothetical protein